MAEQIRGAASAEGTVTLLKNEDDMHQVGLGYVRFVRSE